MLAPKSGHSHRLGHIPFGVLRGEAMNPEWLHEIGYPIFFDTKIGHFNIVGHVLPVVVRFVPLRLQMEEEELDEAIFQHYLFEGMSDRFCRKHDYPANSRQFENKERTHPLKAWGGGISRYHDQVTTFNEIPTGSIEYLRSRIEKNADYCIFHIDSNLFFENNPETKLENFYYETSEAYLPIRKHNAPKQFYLSKRPFEDIEEANKNDFAWSVVPSGTVNEEVSGRGYIESVFFDIWNYVTVQSDEVLLSRQVYRENLMKLGKLSFRWDYGRHCDQDLIKEVNTLADSSSSYFDPLGKFIHSFVLDLHDDIVERNSAKQCEFEFCGKLFSYKGNKRYCSPVSEGRDCGKKARNQRYYIKRTLQNPTEN
jgi:hypothetical protein